MAEPRVAVIQPRLDGRGGLEKYCCFLVQALAELGPVEVVSAHRVRPELFETAFNLRLDGARFREDPRCDPDGAAGGGRLARLLGGGPGREYYRLTSEYDLVFGHTIGLPWECGARRSVLVCHFPTVKRHRLNPAVAPSPLTPEGREQREIRRRVASWEAVVCNSRFGRHWIHRYWGRDATVIYPPIETAPEPDLPGKRPWIVAAGYFARPAVPGDPWGYKRQEVMIDAFRRCCTAGLEGWELHLAGPVLLPPDDAAAYLGELRDRAAGLTVRFHTDCPHSELVELYHRSALVWHAAGYGLDPEEYPDRMEHFGMVTAEAMGHGCVPVVIARGGQPEIVAAGESGFLWEDLEELVDRTLLLSRDRPLREQFARAAAARARAFSIPRFRARVHALVETMQP